MANGAEVGVALLALPPPRAPVDPGAPTLRMVVTLPVLRYCVASALHKSRARWAARMVFEVLEEILHVLGTEPHTVRP